MSEMYDVTITVMRPNGEITDRQESWPQEQLDSFLKELRIWPRFSDGVMTLSMFERDKKPSFLKKGRIRLRYVLMKIEKRDYLKEWKEKKVRFGSAILSSGWILYK